MKQEKEAFIKERSERNLKNEKTKYYRNAGKSQ